MRTEWFIPVARSNSRLSGGEIPSRARRRVCHLHAGAVGGRGAGGLPAVKRPRGPDFLPLVVQR